MKTRWMRMVISVFGIVFLCWSITLLAQEEAAEESTEGAEEEVEELEEAQPELPEEAEEAVEELEEAEPELPELPIAEPLMGLPGEEAEGMRESLGLGTTEEEGVQKVIYVVQTGDNLWDIANRFMNSPYYWPKIWERNSFIIDPHLIYPGDVLNLYPTGQKIKVKDMDMGMIEVISLGEGVEGLITGEGEIQKIVYKETSSTGYIETEEREKAGKILDSLDHKRLLGEPDRVYVNIGESLGVREGDLFSIFKITKAINHPVTQRPVGYKILNLGELKIVDAKEDSSEAEIVNSYMEIMNGDLIRPYTAPLSKEIPVTASTLEVEGYIVEPKEDAERFGKGDIVYIDKGREDGLEQGVMLEIYIPGEKIQERIFRQERQILPDKVIGRMIVVEPREHTSVVLVTHSEREMKKGMAFRLASMD